MSLADRNQTPTRRVKPRWWWLAGSLSFLALTFGCSPASFYYLLLPFQDDKIQPRCKLVKDKGESTVVVYATFARGDVPLDLEPAANDLADVLAVQLRKRFAANKEKVAVVAPAKVRSYLNNRLGQTPEPREIGEEFKADYVLKLEIQKMSLYQPGSSKTLFRGQADIAVSVVDLQAKEGEDQKFSDLFHADHGPKDAGGISSMQFRTLFVNRMAVNLSRWFAAYPKDERLQMTEGGL